MIKDATVNRGKVALAAISGGVARDRNSKAVINRILQLLFAPDVSLRRLHRSVPEQKPYLFEFATAIMAEPGAAAAIMPNQDYAGCRGLRRAGAVGDEKRFGIVQLRSGDPHPDCLRERGLAESSLLNYVPAAEGLLFSRFGQKDSVMVIKVIPPTTADSPHLAKRNDSTSKNI